MRVVAFCLRMRDFGSLAFARYKLHLLYIHIHTNIFTYRYILHMINCTSKQQNNPLLTFWQTCVHTKEGGNTASDVKCGEIE